VKKWTVVIIVFFMGVTVPVYAQYSSTAYGGGKNETVLNRVSDWFATVGKTMEQKYIIKKNRRAARKIRKAKKAIAQRKIKIQKIKNAYKR